MKRIVVAFALLLCGAIGAFAQNVEQGIAVTACGTPGRTYTAGSPGAFTLDTNGNLCFTGSGGSIVAAPYQWTPNGTPQYNFAITTAQSLTVPANSIAARVCVRSSGGATVNFSEDGTAPNTTTGTNMVGGQCIYFVGSAILSALQFIQSAVSATLDVVYYR